MRISSTPAQLTIDIRDNKRIEVLHQAADAITRQSVFETVLRGQVSMLGVVFGGIRNTLGRYRINAN